MLRRLFWLGALVGAGYVVWRWFRQSDQALTPPIYPTPAQPAPNFSSPRPAPATPAPAAEAAPTPTTRRIVTRVHRGAPPAMSSTKPATAAPAAAEEPVVAAPAAAEEPVVAAPAAAEEPAATAAPAAPDEPLAIVEPGLTNLNTADEAALIALPGIGPTLARRIIAYRNEHGPFASVEALEAVQGIGTRNLDEFRHLVTV